MMQSADMFKYTDETDMFQLLCKALTCLSIQTKLHVSTIMQSADMFKYTDETDMFQL